MTPDRDGFQIDEDPDLQRRVWKFQRAGWVVLGAGVGAAMSGLFGGGGPLARVSDGGQVRVEYDRFARRGAPAEVAVWIPAGVEPVVEFDGSLVEGARAGSITPWPTEVVGAEGVLRLEFAREAGAGLRVSVRFEPERAGLRSGRVVAGGDGVEVWQLVYP
jgi:hypothetical protein